MLLSQGHRALQGALLVANHHCLRLQWHLRGLVLLADRQCLCRLSLMKAGMLRRARASAVRCVACAVCAPGAQQRGAQHMCATRGALLQRWLAAAHTSPSSFAHVYGLTHADACTWHACVHTLKRTHTCAHTLSLLVPLLLTQQMQSPPPPPTLSMDGAMPDPSVSSSSSHSPLPPKTPRGRHNLGHLDDDADDEAVDGVITLHVSQVAVV